MIDEEICKLREKLNQSIIDEKDYNIIYQISIELDELIAQYYSKNINNSSMIYSKKGKKRKKCCNL